MTPEQLFATAHKAGLDACADIPDTGPVGYSKCRINGKSSFAIWCRKNNHAVSGRYGMFGSGTWISDSCGKQAISASKAYIDAFASVLESEGIATFTWSWYD